MQKLFTLLAYVFIALVYSQTASAQTLVCQQFLNVSLDNTGQAVVHKSIFIEGNYNFLVTSIDIQDGSGNSLPGYSDGDNAQFSCVDVGRVLVYVITDTLTNNQCWGHVKIEDKLAPVPYLVNNRVLTLDSLTCSVEAYAKDFDLGSFDNCGPLHFSFGDFPHIPSPITQNGQTVDLTVEHYFVTPGTILSSVAAAPANLHADYQIGGLYKWDPTELSAAKVFTGFDQGQLDISVFDESYNSQYGSLTVQFAGCGVINSPLCKNSLTTYTSPWSGNTTIYPTDVIDYLPANHDASISKDGINYSNSITLTCNDIGQPLDIYGRFTASNGDTVSCTIEINYQDVIPPVMIAETYYHVELTDSLDVVTLQVADIDDGSYDNCTLTSLTLSETVFDISDRGENLVQLTGTDASGNHNTVYTHVYVSIGPCSSNDIEITYPDTILRVLDPFAQWQDMSQQTLINTYGFSPQQVGPTIDFTCNILAYNYTDNHFEVTVNGTEYFKIIRTFVVIDWITLWTDTFVQEITNVPQSDDYICDTQPRSAPVTDCMGGHTLTDDVEWPNDITIDDYRLDPSDLVVFSGIDSLDAWPTLYDKVSEYAMTYEDIVFSLSPDSLIINRRWTVLHWGTVQLWTYKQVIRVVVSNFNGLVSVTDVQGRAIPNVVINGSSTTDQSGNAVVNSAVTSATYDAGQIEYTVRDLITISRHILGIEEITDTALLIAADVNEDSMITGADIVLLREIMLGNEAPLEYQFVERTDNQGILLEPQAIVIGYRPGDADGTGIVEDELSSTSALKVDDILLNAGQTYSVSIYKSEDQAIRGIEAIMSFDPDMIEVQAVESVLDASTRWKLRNDNELHIIAEDASGELVESGDPLYTITVTARTNTVLSSVLSAPHSFQLVDDNLEILSTEELDIEDIITVGTEETLSAEVAIYPNPASNWISIEAAGDVMRSTVYSPVGQKVLTTTQATLDVQALPTGIYTIIVETSEGIGRQRVSIIR